MIRFPVRKSTSPVLASFPVLFFAFSLIGSWHRFDELCGYPIIHNSLFSLCLFFLVVTLHAQFMHTRLVHSCIQTFHSAIVRKKIIASFFNGPTSRYTGGFFQNHSTKHGSKSSNTEWRFLRPSDTMFTQNMTNLTLLNSVKIKPNNELLCARPDPQDGR